jgi:DNA-binding beta-propeller fold protein YncE
MIRALLPILFCAVFTNPAQAARLPDGLQRTVKQIFKGCRIRIDGSIETRNGDLLLPILPPIARDEAHAKIVYAYPDSAQASIITFDDGYSFIKLERIGTYRTFVLPVALPDSVRHQITTGLLPEDLVVPEAFVLPQSLAALQHGLDVRIIPDKLLTAQSAANQNGDKDNSGATDVSKTGSIESSILVASVRVGTIIMLNPKTFEKISDFPTEGTPTGMVYVGGKVYIADEGKNRVLILDCEKREFLGQINLLPKSAPRGIARLPNGRLLYLSESSAGDVAVIETATHKILLRTKVAAGPGKIAITPNGLLVLVLHGPSGLLSILSTANQRLLTPVRVGNAPSSLVITSNSQIAYVANRASNSISVVDLDKKQAIGSLATGAGPTSLALSKDNLTLYVVNARENTLGVYDLKTRKKPNLLKLPPDIDFPSSITLSPGGKQLFITSEGTTSLAVFNTESQTFDKAIPVGCPSHQVLFIP